MKKLLRLFNIGIFLFLGGVVNAKTGLLSLANMRFRIIDSTVWLISVLTLLLSMAGSVVADDFVDLLGLESSKAGDSMGENLTVFEFDNGGYFLAATKKGVVGKLKLPVNLSKTFEVTLDVFAGQTLGSDEIKIFLLASDDTRIGVGVASMFVGFTGEYANGTKHMEYLPEGWKGDNLGSAWNDLRLSVADGEAKLYVNDVFLDKVTPNNPDASYTNLVIDGVRSVDGITGVGVKGTGTTPPSNGGNFEEGKQAGIQQCVSDPASCGISVSGGTCTGGAHATYTPTTGEVYIPLIDVPGPFGGIQTYEVYLVQQPLTFTFDLDMNRINPR